MAADPAPGLTGAASAEARAFDALDRRLERGATRPIAVALSGGGDSTALLWLAARWARASGRRLLALTVDHGLNPDSPGWTRCAGELAQRLGADWRPLAWTGDKPSTGLPAAARHARHALLAQAAREAGACVLLIGHTLDDVAESELIRRDTPAHGRLAEWSPSPAWPEGRGVFLLRPLLGAQRGELRALLTAAGLDWLDDPANADLRFARTRARAALAQMGIGELPARDAPPQGRAEADAVGCIRLPRDVGAELLAKAVLCASGGDRPPRGDALALVAQRLRGGEAFRSVLGGARILAAGEVLLVRDAGEWSRAGARPPPPVPAPAVFDGRFGIEAAPGVHVTPLKGLAARLTDRDTERLHALPAEARQALPALLTPDGTLHLPAPFGGGPGEATALAPRRLAAAQGLIATEAEAARPANVWIGARIGA